MHVAPKCVLTCDATYDSYEICSCTAFESCSSHHPFVMLACVLCVCVARLRAVEAARAEAEARAAAHAAGEEVVRMQLAKAQVGITNISHPLNSFEDRA